MIKKKREKFPPKSKDNILIQPDMQFPYCHKDALPFLKYVADKLGCGRVINVGDLLDNHHMSEYQKHPDAPNIVEEAEMVKKLFKDFHKVFPNTEVIWGNHDRRVTKQLEKVGFPEELISLDHIYRHVFDMPDSWSTQDDIKWDTERGGPWLALHGCESGLDAGNPGRPVEKTLGYSVVHGHLHSMACVAAVRTTGGIRYHMNVGSLIDYDAHVYRYGASAIKKPISSCGVIIKGVPRLVIMIEDEKGRWTGEII